jgi:hypothetical protein
MVHARPTTACPALHRSPRAGKPISLFRPRIGSRTRRGQWLRRSRRPRWRSSASRRASRAFRCRLGTHRRAFRSSACRFLLLSEACADRGSTPCSNGTQTSQARSVGNATWRRRRTHHVRSTLKQAAAYGGRHDHGVHRQPLTGSACRVDWPDPSPVRWTPQIHDMQRMRLPRGSRRSTSRRPRGGLETPPGSIGAASALLVASRAPGPQITDHKSVLVSNPPRRSSLRRHPAD